MKLVLSGTIAGVVLTIVLIASTPRTCGFRSAILSRSAYVVGPAIAVLVAVVASLATARRAASGQPMVAVRSVLAF